MVVVGSALTSCGRGDKALSKLVTGGHSSEIFLLASCSRGEPRSTEACWPRAKCLFGSAVRSGTHILRHRTTVGRLVGKVLQLEKG